MPRSIPFTNVPLVFKEPNLIMGFYIVYKGLSNSVLMIYCNQHNYTFCVIFERPPFFTETVYLRAVVHISY